MSEPSVEFENPDQMGFWRWIWMYWLARLRISEKAVCTMSRNQGIVDHHDYDDSIEGQPWHFMLLTCKRCNKKFTI